jgi:signal transduction histidine kinase
MMFANLIKNAIEASPDNATIRVSLRDEETDGRGTHLIDIFNRGSISPDIRDTFFAPYSTSDKKGGTGLGTYSASLIAKAHKGDIQFTTSEEEGTHVIVMLPKKIA